MLTSVLEVELSAVRSISIIFRSPPPELFPCGLSILVEASNSNRFPRLTFSFFSSPIKSKNEISPFDFSYVEVGVDVA